MYKLLFYSKGMPARKGKYIMGVYIFLPCGRV